MSSTIAQAQTETPAPPTDDELAARAARREDGGRVPRDAVDAFEQIHQRHARALAAYLAARAPDDADDLLQETWGKAWENLPSGYHGGNLRAWLFQIARHLLIDHVRKRRPDLVDPSALSLRDGRNATVESRLLERERAEALLACLEQLPAREAAVVCARLEGDSYEEICQRLTLTSISHAYKLYHAARKTLQSCVERRLG